VELLEVLGTLGRTETEGLAVHRRPPVANAAGQVVGHLEARVRAEVAGGTEP
jgi:hypothetical protein